MSKSLKTQPQRFSMMIMSWSSMIVAILALLLTNHATMASIVSSEIDPPVAVTTMSSAAVTTNDQISDEQRHRALQYSIGPNPDISYVGFRLALDYQVSASVTPENVRTSYYRDEDCNRRLDPETEGAISTDIIPDSQPSSGAGTRTMGIHLNFDPTSINTSRQISFTETQGILSFCIKFELIDDSCDGACAALDTPVTLGIALESNVGIIELIDEDPSAYGIIVYECDDDDVPLSESAISGRSALTQGNTIQFCIKPDDFSVSYGVILRSIVSFRLSRGDVIQDVLVPNGIIVNYAQTAYACQPGGLLCKLKTLLSNDFFFSSGTLNGAGSVQMQYQYSGTGRRELVEKEVKVTFMPPPSSSSSSDLVVNANNFADDDDSFLPPPLPPALLTSAQRSELQKRNERSLREAGGIVGNRDFSMTFTITPSSANFVAEAFECDSQNKPIKGVSTKELGGSVRVCVRPNQAARDGLVFMRSINNFRFVQNETDITQFAVENGRESNDGETFLLCFPGDPVCAFKTLLKEKFFEQNETITGTGEIFLQFGNDKFISGTGTGTAGGRRELQITDPSFAGSNRVSFIFFPNNPYDEPEDKTWQEEVDDWWHNSPLLMRFIYILIPVLLLIFLCCCIITCCCGCPAWCFKGRDEKEEYHEEHHETHIRHEEGPPPEDGYKENGYYDDGEEDPLEGLDEEEEEEDEYTMGEESQEQPRSSRRGGRRGRAPDSQSGTFA